MELAHNNLHDYLIASENYKLEMEEVLHTLAHEFVAHAIKSLINISSTQEEDHKEYNHDHEAGQNSPGTQRTHQK